MTDAEKKAWIKHIHAVKNELKLSDEQYRSVLLAAGLGSSREIRARYQYREIMRAFAKLGYRAKERDERQPPQTPEEKTPWMSARQEYYIRGLWQLCARNTSDKALDALVLRVVGVDSVRFLTRSGAQKVITALRDIARKAGYNPDRAEPE